MPPGAIAGSWRPLLLGGAASVPTLIRTNGADRDVSPRSDAWCRDCRGPGARVASAGRCRSEASASGSRSPNGRSASRWHDTQDPVVGRDRVTPAVAVARRHVQRTVWALDDCAQPAVRAVEQHLLAGDAFAAERQTVQRPAVQVAGPEGDGVQPPSALDPDRPRTRQRPAQFRGGGETGRGGRSVRGG
jgi:hypothetical protein